MFTIKQSHYQTKLPQYVILTVLKFSARSEYGLFIYKAIYFFCRLLSSLETKWTVLTTFCYLNKSISRKTNLILFLKYFILRLLFVFFIVVLLNFQLKQKIRNICFMNSSSFLISHINLHNRLLHVQNSALISIWHPDVFGSQTEKRKQVSFLPFNVLACIVRILV